MKQFIIHTFGCQMNVHDSEKMAWLLSGMGYLQAEKDAEADLILFNTCTVRDHAHHKAISEIGRAITLKKGRPGLIVGVCGCVAQEEKARLFEIYSELDLVFGPDQISKLPDLLKEIMLHASCIMPRRAEAGSMKQETGKIIATELIDDPDEYNWTSFLTPARRHTSTPIRVSAFLTIMKGCNNNCSFCIVPKVRGREISRPADDIVAEVKALVEGGVKEVTLLGQNVNSFVSSLVRWFVGKTSDERTNAPTHQRTNFVQLLRRISNETDILRIRYTSPHPKDLGNDLIEEHAANAKLCRHMHLPLQAGSDRILRLMKRSYDKRQFLDKVDRLRRVAAGIDITTDIIVGFPGETESDFKDTLDVVKEAAFDGMFAFKYSPRPGTKATELNDDVPQAEKEERLQRLLKLNAEIWKEKTQRLVGTVQEVLVEGLSRKQGAVSGERSGKTINSVCLGPTNQRTNELTHQLTGRTFANKIVNFSGNLDLVGHIVPVVITNAGANSLKGKLITK